jgi:glucan phosphoethanolaminetransferase (alkaline phosphatase superfamily)
MKKKSKRYEFSKVLAMITTLLFVVCVMFSLIVRYKEDRVPDLVLNYVATPFGVVLTGYFLKSGFENYKKISQSQPAVINKAQPVKEEDDGQDANY